MLAHLASSQNSVMGRTLSGLWATPAMISSQGVSL